MDKKSWTLPFLIENQKEGTQETEVLRFYFFSLPFSLLAVCFQCVTWKWSRKLCRLPGRAVVHPSVVHYLVLYVCRNKRIDWQRSDTLILTVLVLHLSSYSHSSWAWKRKGLEEGMLPSPSCPAKWLCVWDQWASQPWEKQGWSEGRGSALYEAVRRVQPSSPRAACANWSCLKASLDCLGAMGFVEGRWRGAHTSLNCLLVQTPEYWLLTDCRWFRSSSQSTFCNWYVDC